MRRAAGHEREHNHDRHAARLVARAPEHSARAHPAHCEARARPDRCACACARAQTDASAHSRGRPDGARARLRALQSGHHEAARLASDRRRRQAAAARGGRHTRLALRLRAHLLTS